MVKLMKIELSINIENELEQRAILDALGGINLRLSDIRDHEILEFEKRKSIKDQMYAVKALISHGISFPEQTSEALDAAISHILSAKAKIKEREKDGITFHL